MHRGTIVAIEDSEFRSFLLQLAGRFSQDETFKQRLVARTVAVLCDNPEVFDRNRPAHAVVRVMYQLAREELGIVRRPKR